MSSGRKVHNPHNILEGIGERVETELIERGRERERERERKRENERERNTSDSSFARRRAGINNFVR